MYLIGQFSAGKTILWHAAASSVSIAGIQLSRADNASAVYATARQDSKCDFAVKELGATAAFNTTSQNWVDVNEKRPQHSNCYETAELHKEAGVLVPISETIPVATEMIGNDV